MANVVIQNLFHKIWPRFRYVVIHISHHFSSCLVDNLVIREAKENVNRIRSLLAMIDSCNCDRSRPVPCRHRKLYPWIVGCLPWLSGEWKQTIGIADLLITNSQRSRGDWNFLTFILHFSFESCTWTKIFLCFRQEINYDLVSLIVNCNFLNS